MQLLYEMILGTLVIVYAHMFCQKYEHRRQIAFATKEVTRLEFELRLLENNPCPQTGQGLHPKVDSVI